MKYITTPIYYVNDNPHIGHAVTTLAADVLARYYRIKNEPVFFLTGTDEHGAKIAQAAEVKNQPTQLFVDQVSEAFQQTWEDLAIKSDGFIRTTHPAHIAYVQRFLQELYDNGHIYKGEYTGWYCVGCEEFKTETQIGPENTCPIHLKPLQQVSEEAYHFKLSAFADQIKKVISSDALKIRPESRKNEVLSFISSELLHDVAISRKNVAWGIPLPWDTDHTVYVWIDALLNYLSAVEGEVFTDKKPAFPPSIQIIGKDILRFHAVIWPALLLAAGKELPQNLFVHGYFTIDGHKMSKSLGNVIAPQALINRYGIDGARYLLLTVVPFGNDGDLSYGRLDNLYTSDLANNLGNLVNRVQAMLQKYTNSVVPQNVHRGSLIFASPTTVIEEINISGYLAYVQKAVDTCNGYIQEKQPWTLAKENNSELLVVLSELAEAIYQIGALIAPFLPETSAKILSMFGSSIADIDYDTLHAANHTAGKTITPILPLFPRLETE